MVYDNAAVADMLHILGERHGGLKAAARLWRERFPDRTPHSKNVFSRLSKRVRTKGIIQPDHNKGRRICRLVRDDRAADILASVEVHPVTL